MEKKLSVGQLLSVPFGHRTVRGFAMAVHEDDDEDRNGKYELKPVGAIVDPQPFFSASLIELVKKLSTYTASPLESVLKAAVPAAVVKPNARAKELYFVEPALVNAQEKITTRQKWLYDQIVRLGGGWMQQLCRELKTTTSSLKEMGRIGLVKVALRKKRRDPLSGKRILPSRPLALNQSQSVALAALTDRTDMRPVLLFGIKIGRAHV